MKLQTLYWVWYLLLAGTIYFSATLGNLEKEIAQRTDPPFNYIEFEIPPDREFSKKLYASIHENQMTTKVQTTLDKDNWFILFYASAIILGCILLLKRFNVEKAWLFYLIAALGVVAGVCDAIENSHLESLLKNWEAAAAEGSVEKAATFATVKFAIILPLALGGLLGWGYFLIKKLFSRNREI